MAGINEAIQRLANDREFRVEILQDTNAALAQYQLNADDIERVLQQAQMIEAEIKDYPMEATEADHGEADAAGAKN